MPVMTHIDHATVQQQFARVILNHQHMPTKRRDTLVLLVSMATCFVPGRQYTGNEVDDILQTWIARYCTRLSVDHATLRRLMVDEGLLTRDAAGSRYAANTDGRFFTFDSDCRTLDFDALIIAEQQRRAQQRRDFLNQQTGTPNP